MITQKFNTTLQEQIEKLEKELAQTSYLDVLHQEMLERELERLKKIASEMELTKNEWIWKAVREYWKIESN